MSEIPSELRYSFAHTWIALQDDDTVKVGITDHAQKELGDIIYVELPEIEKTYSYGDECAVVESVKSASDIYCPLTGEVTLVNTSLEDNPEIINTDPYGDGWIFVMIPDDLSEVDELLDADSYREKIEE